MDHKLIIAFVGLPLSGKSTAARVAQNLGFPVVVMGDIIRDEVLHRGLELTDHNAGKIATELREKEGMDAIARRCVPLIKARRESVIVIDGIRSDSEVEHFKQEFGQNFILINIQAERDERFDRSVRRERGDDIVTIEELKSRDQRELSWSMQKAIERSDLTIENNSTLDKFNEKVEEVLKRVSRYVEVEISTQIHPTEDKERVVQAIKNFFPDAQISTDNGHLTAHAQNLSTFRELLRRQKILDTARTELRENTRHNTIHIYLNKQTAVVSKINFTEKDVVLSPIKVEFRVYGIDMSRFIDYLAPHTREGKPVVELESL
ncbi:MAG: AAA family ATPase [Archaeoglobaceae archaeon]